MFLVEKMKSKITIVQERFQKARQHLGLSQNFVAKEIGLTNTAINRFESGKSDRPNWDYGEYLVRNGVNYFYLIGASEEIEGQKLNDVTRAEYEALQNQLHGLQISHKELQDRYGVLERVLELLQIEVDDNGNVIQKLKK